MFTVQEVAEFVRGTLGSMPSTVHIGQSMDVVKLQSIARTVDSRLFSFPGKVLIWLKILIIDKSFYLSLIYGAQWWKEGYECVFKCMSRNKKQKDVKQMTAYLPKMLILGKFSLAYDLKINYLNHFFLRFILNSLGVTLLITI